jgi:hypothetical protein
MVLIFFSKAGYMELVLQKFRLTEWQPKLASSRGCNLARMGAAHFTSIRFGSLPRSKDTFSAPISVSIRLDQSLD